MIIKKCKCGSTDFIIDEGVAHSAEVDDEGILTCVGGCDEGEIIKIVCSECEEVYSEDNFNQINF